MKEFVRNFSLFIVLCFALSLWSSCSNQKNEQANSGSGGTANSSANSRSSEYPPVPTAVAQSDLKNLDGTTFKVADKKGKVLLLNMWATWCGPCRAEMPSLVALQDKFRDKDFEVLGLDTDDEKADDIRRFAGDMKLNYTLVWADNNMQSELVNISKFGGIPQSFLVDREGHLRAVFKGGSPAEIQKMSELVESVVNE
jgi:thiol-disulfide isomerase/thioredoxin